MLSWLILCEGSAKQWTGNVWTFQGSTQPPSSSSSSVLSQAKWVFIPSGQACRLDPRAKSEPVLKSSDRPGSQHSVPARVGAGGTTGLKRSFADKYCHFIETFLFVEGQTCVIFLFQWKWKEMANLSSEDNRFKSCPAGGDVVAPGCGLIIHSHSGQTWGQCGGRALYTTSNPPLICISMTHRERDHFAF